MKKKILISGGAGFIGANVSIKLLSKGYDVTVMDNLSEQIHGKDMDRSFLYNLIKNKVSFIRGDVRNKYDWEKALKGQDAIIHLAAETGTAQSMYQVYKYIDVNVSGTALMLDILANNSHNIKKIVIASSRAVYGEGCYWCTEHKEVFPATRNEKELIKKQFECLCPICNGQLELIPTHEEAKIDPQSVYGASKYQQEQLLFVSAKSLNINAVSMRYQNVYGPGQSLSNPYTGILSIFSTQIKNNNPINIFEDGKESRDFVYIDDVVNATVLGLEDDAANFNIYNVGTGVPVCVSTIANKLIELYGIDVPLIISGNFRLGDIRHNFADISKIKKELGYSPEYSFESGINKFASWVNSQEINKDSYSESIMELKAKGLFK